MKQTVLDRLAAIGVHPTPEQIAEYERVMAKAAEQYGTVADFGDHDASSALSLAAWLGSGDFDATPCSLCPEAIYAFDAEVFEVDEMYTLFFRNIAPMIPDATFTDITEDLSGLTEEMDMDAEPPTDGTRSVSLRCNGALTTFILKSYGDWFNPDIIDLLNDILLKAGCAGQLHGCEVPMDQCMIFVYGDRAKGEALIQLHQDAMQELLG